MTLTIDSDEFAEPFWGPSSHPPEQIEPEPYLPHSRGLGELYLETLKELATPYPSIELPGWPKLNELLGGFRAREFTILCGSTGSGKTALLASWAKAFMLAEKRCFVMSVETGHTDFIKRTMSAFVGVDINRGTALDHETLKMFHTKHGARFSTDEMFLSLYDNRVDHKTVMKDIVWHRENKKCEIVFIDNLNFLLEVVSANRQIEVMDKVVHDLIMLAKTTDVHIVMVMHPRKTENTRVESEFDIKGSSTAVQESHNILCFNRPTQKDLNNATRGPHLRELMIRKVRRRGESIGKSLWLRYTGANYIEQSVEDTHRA